MLCTYIVYACMVSENVCVLHMLDNNVILPTGYLCRCMLVCQSGTQTLKQDAPHVTVNSH